MKKIDTIHPRFWMLDNASMIVHHNTRTLREKHEPGDAGSLLGDYLEFGVSKGVTFGHAYARAAPLMPWMRFWAFDSFQGLPEPVGSDVGGEFWEGQFACDEASFLKNVTEAGVDMKRVVCVPGWFNETLTPDLKRENSLTVASMVYIDADLYNSTVPVLEFIADLVETGTVLMFDDWFCFRADRGRGVQRACAEWLHRHPSISLLDWHLFGPYGKSFFVNRHDG